MSTTPTIMSTGQITIVDLTDQRNSSFYLTANQSKIQSYNPNEQDPAKQYSPDYSISPNLKIEPTLILGNEDYTSKIPSDSISYKINNMLVDGSHTDEAYQDGKSLYILQNIGAGGASGFFKNGVKTLVIEATIKEKTITDERTGITIEQVLKANIDFVRMDQGQHGDNGDPGVGIDTIRELFQLLSTDADGNRLEPTKPTQGNLGNWKPEQPAWKDGHYLWRCTEFTYTNNSCSYTDPIVDDTWAAAVAAIAVANQNYETLSSQVTMLQNEVDSVIDTWFVDKSPTENGFSNPWAGMDGELDEYHTGDLLYNTVTGESYRFVHQDFDSDGNKEYGWTLVTDEPVSAALQQVQALQTKIDGKVSIYYGDVQDWEITQPQKDDMWVKDDGSFYRYDGNSWTLSSSTVERFEIQFYSNTDPTDVPDNFIDTEGWVLTSPTWEEGKYIWQRTVAYFNGNQDPDISDPVCISAAAAKGISVSGEQVFKSADGESYLPDTITLTAHCSGGLTAGKWFYKNSDGNWVNLEQIVDSVSTQVTGASCTISPSDNIFVNGTSASVKVVSEQSDNFYDIFSIFKVSDGQDGNDGDPAYNVYLTNEHIQFSANPEGKLAARMEEFINVICFRGTEKVAPTVGTISFGSGTPNFTLAKAGVMSKEYVLKLTAAADALIGNSPSETSGQIEITITAPVKTTLYLNWSKTNSGKKGESAIYAIVQSTNGKVGFTDEKPEDITLKADLYADGIIQSDTAVSYNWTSIPESAAALGTTKTLTVKRDDITGAKSYVCTMTYKEKTYQDAIVISDHTDPIYCVIESSNGDKFTNGQISTELTCRVYTSNGEIDYSKANYVYTWHKYVNGAKDTKWTERTERKITISSSDVTNKAVFSCTVTEGTTPTE